MKPRIPMGQGRQDVASGEAYVPCWQIEQKVEPEVEAMLPGAQEEHCVESLAPELLENLPGEQGIQPLEVCPEDGL